MEIIEQTNSDTFGWRSLQAFAAAANLTVLLAIGLFQADSLALALAAVTLAGLTLTRFRSGLIGILLLGLLFADIAVWTVSGAVSNFVHREGGLALLQPSLLGSISLVGIVSTAATLLGFRRAHTGSRIAAWVGAVGLSLLLLAVAASLLISGPASAGRQPETVALGSKGMAFTSSHLSSSSGEITLTLANEDLWWHTFTIDELDVDLNVPMGAERSITFAASPGEYYFYCAIPGHEALGMHGTLVVEE
jgi:plastocyanin